METCEYCGRRFVVTTGDNIWWGYSSTYTPKDFHEVLKGAWVEDPFEEEIHHDSTEHWLCQDCFAQSMWDI